MLINVVLTIGFACLMGFGQMILNNASKTIFQNSFNLYTLITNIYLISGIFIYIASFVLWLYIISRFDIRIAYPLASTAIFFSAIFQFIETKDYPPTTYWIGLVLVFLGLLIASIAILKK
jgi:undecaprenyl phosphate-alpha-L-ara4N flippase subunit ArnE